MLIYHSADQNYGETRVGNTLTDLPGLAFANKYVTSRNRTREIDWIVITNNTIASIEVKGTKQTGTLITNPNGPWTIGGQKADFVGGPNPLGQTRKGASTVRGHLDTTNTALGHYINAITVISGDIITDPHKVGDTWVCTPHQLPGVLMRIGRKNINQQTASAIAAALGQPHLTTQQLENENFNTENEPTKQPKTNNDKRREKRRTNMETIANNLWETSHKRRVIASGIAGSLSILYLTRRPWETIIAGIILTIGVAVGQLMMKKRLQGPKKQGPGAALIWLITLTPYIGVGAALTTPLFTNQPTTDLLVLDITLSILIASGLWLSTYTGHCGYIYPPSVVVERLDAKNNPTGTYMLADPSRKNTRFDGKLVDQADPRTKTLNVE